MSKINFLTIAVVLLLLLNAGTLVFMFRMHTSHTETSQRRGEGPAAFIIEALQLDAQQQQQFAGLRKEHQQAIRAVHEEDRRLHDAYFDLLKTDHPDRAKVDSLALLIGAEENLLSKTTFEHFEKLRALCRDDQKKLFDATIDEISHRMALPPHGRPDGPPPPQGQDGPPPPQDGPPR